MTNVDQIREELQLAQQALDRAKKAVDESPTPADTYPNGTVVKWSNTGAYQQYDSVAIKAFNVWNTNNIREPLTWEQLYQEQLIHSKQPVCVAISEKPLYTEDHRAVMAR